MTPVYKAMPDSASHSLSRTIMLSKPISTCLCLSLALCLASPATAQASSPGESAAETSEPPVSVELQVDTSDVDEQFRRQLELIVMRQLPHNLEQAGYELIDEGGEIVLRVRFSRTEAGGFRDQGIHFEFIDGGSTKPAVQWILCEGCVQIRLEEKLEGVLPQLLEALDDAATALTASPNGDGDGDVNNPPIGPIPKPIGPVGIGGAVGLALGIGLSVGGGIVLANPSQQKYEDGKILAVEIDRTPLGLSLLIPGAALVVAGTVMLAVDLSKRAKQRKRAHDITVIPTLSPSSAGIGVAGRF